MSWRTVKSVEELRSLGKLKAISEEIAKEIHAVNVPKSSWNMLFSYIQNYLNKASQSHQNDAVVSMYTTDWSQIESVSDLKALGCFLEVKRLVQQQCNIGKFKGKGWEDLLQVIKKKRVCTQYVSNYFKDESSEIIYCILELQGEARVQKLGINRLHYVDKQYAREWKNKLIKVIHPDQCTHVNANEATIELNKLYGEMIKYAK